MTKWFLTLLILTGLLLAACGDPSMPKQDASEQATITATQTLQPTKTSTPTPPGTWETVIEGTIYDRSTEPGRPIVGASITCNVHSYFPGLQEGKANKTTTDQLGKFVLPVTVHDTDSIRILIEAQGYILCEEKLVGVDLLAGGYFEIGLTPD
jgi:hypothetical protein